MCATRALGRELRPRIEERLAAVKAGWQLRVALDAEVVDYSFADEAFGEVLRSVVDGRYGDRFLTFSGDQMDAFENLDASCRLRGLMAVAAFRTGDGPNDLLVLGEMARGEGRGRSELVEVLNWLWQVRSATAQAVADRFEIALTAANNRLARLHHLRVVARKSDSVEGGGRQFVYLTLV